MPDTCSDITADDVLIVLHVIRYFMQNWSQIM